MIARVLTLLLLLAGQSAHAATKGSAAAELSHGYFCALETVATEAAKGTVSGTINLVERSPDFIGPGPEVPARLGIGFGVKVRMAPGLTGRATVRVQHPPMGPQAVTRQHWQTTLTDERAQYLGYTFEQSYELLPGPWSLSASANGRPIYSVSFTVVDPRQMPWVNCGAQIPLS